MMMAAAALSRHETGAAPAFSIVEQAVEYLHEPLGLDVPPRFSWKLSPRDQPARGLSPLAYRLTVRHLQNESVIWDSGKTASATTHLVAYAGPPLRSDGRFSWSVISFLNDGSAVESPRASFGTALLRADEWKATWITGGDAARLLRKEFSVASPPRSHATLFVAGIGYHEVELNGNKVGDGKLDAGWSTFSKRVYFNSFDVTHLLARGVNAVGVSLGNGWFSCGVSPGTSQPGCVNSPPQLLLQLQIDETPVLLSDLSWKVHAGPITYDSLYNGEHYDGRLEEQVAGWSTAPFNDAQWQAAAYAKSAANGALLASRLFQPIRHLKTFAPLAVRSPRLGVQVFDFGQNMAGVVRLKGMRCAAGSNVTIRHAELLMHPPYGDYDGSTIYVGNLRGAKATDIYTCRGDGSGETYAPTFTQHGFRYAEVSGLLAPLTETQVEAVEMHTDIQQHSSVVFASPMLNAIQHATLWGQKSNVMSVPTDCDQRDERRGWTGDAALTFEEALYNFGMGAVYSRWLDEFRDDQAADGASNDFVPALGQGDGAPNWQSAFPSIVWGLYKYYGDTAVVRRNYAALSRYYDNLERLYNSSSKLAAYATGFGDWVPAGPMGNTHLIGAFALLHDLQMGASFFNISDLPAGPARAARCALLLRRAAADFHSAFFNASTGYYGTGLQTEQALPLYLGIVPKEVLPRVLNHTIADIAQHGGHTTSGIIGIRCMLDALTDAQRTDVALDMLLSDSYPSYGYMLKGGDHGWEPATTLWELWDSDSQGPSMNSRNHIMFGSVSAWFYRKLIGITPLTPGFERISIRPSGIGHSSLKHASAVVATPRGDIVVSVEANSTSMTLGITLPVGTTSVVAMPLFTTQEVHGAFAISERGASVWCMNAFESGVSGVRAGKLSPDGSYVELEVDSGMYHFEARISTHC